MSSLYELDTPALIVDLDILRDNIEWMARVAKSGGKALRPHTKTHKTPEIAQMQIDAGARGLTVAKLGEAETLADAGFTDLFIANQIVGDIKIARLLDLLERAQVRVGVDSMEVARPLSDAASARRAKIPVFIEVDTGLGRAGTRSQEETLELARRIADSRGLEFAGIFTHEGYLYKISDSAERNEAARKLAATLQTIEEALAAQGTPAREISVGSTPGAPVLADEDGPTELRPGVYVFNDRMQMKLGTASDQCALTVLATVVSVRPDGAVIVDAGSKSLASDRPFADQTMGVVVDHPELVFNGVSEEHGHLMSQGAVSVKVGDKVRILPNHACTCVNMHDTLFVYQEESVVDAWKIAGRGKIR